MTKEEFIELGTRRGYTKEQVEFLWAGKPADLKEEDLSEEVVTILFEYFKGNVAPFLEYLEKAVE